MAHAHGPGECPIVGAQFCGPCGCYGHTAATCARVRDCHEIPDDLFDDLEQETPAPNPVFVIPQTMEAVRAALVSLDIKPMTCQAEGKRKGRELKENLERLQKEMKRRGVTVVHPPTEEQMHRRVQELLSGV
jgi:hypothetical protein